MTCHIPAEPPDHGMAQEPTCQAGADPCGWTDIARQAFNGRPAGDRQPLQSLFDHIEGVSWN